MQRTSIQWTEFTVNPFKARLAGSTATKGGYSSGVGHYCEKVGPGCRHCYSSAMQPRFGLPEFQEQRRGGVEWFLDASKLVSVLRHRGPAKLFWCDMTDMFGEWHPNEWIAACFGVMAATPHITHQVLTKRARRMREWFEWAERADAVGGGVHACVTEMFGIPEVNAYLTKDDSNEGSDPGKSDHLIESPRDWPLPNVHLGVSAENQAAWDSRVAELRNTPACVRWVSVEPQLELIIPGKHDLGQGSECPECGWMVPVDEDGCCATCGEYAMWYGVDGVVTGGESGRRARPFDLAWARAMRDACAEHRVTWFMKQLGAHPVAYQLGSVSRLPRLQDGHGGDPGEWPADIRVREWPAPQETP